VESKETVSNEPANMSQRSLRSRTLDTVSEEMDLGSQERSPDLEEIAIERVRPDMNEVNDKAKVSQSVIDVEVPGLQIDSSDRDSNSKGDEVLSSEIIIVMNMMQQLFQRSDQQFQEMKGGQKQAQEKTDQKFEDLKEGQRLLKEGLQKDIQQVLLECCKSSELLKQELTEKLNTEVGNVTIEVNQVKGEVKKCENKLEREMIGVKQQFER
jgi:hypothetical protein